MLSSPQVRARLNRSCRSLRHVLFFLLFLVFWRETRAAPTDLPSLQDGSPRCCSSSHLLPVCEHPQWRMILGLLRRTLHAQDPNDLNRNVNLHKHPYKGGACLCFYNGRGDRCVDITALRLEDKTLRRMSQEVGDQDHGGNAISLSQFNVAVALSVCICLVGGFVLGAIARPFLNKLYRQHFGRRANKPPGEEVIAVYANAALTNDQCNNSETNGDAKVQQQEHQPSSSNTLKGNSQAKEMKIRNAGYALKARENMLPMFDILNDDLSDTSSEVTMELDQHPSALQGWELLCKDAKGGAGAKWSQDNNDDALYEDLEVQNNQYSDFRVRGEFTQDSAGPVRCIGADKASLDHSSLMSHDDELDIEAWLSQNATLKIEQPDESDEDRGQHGHDNKNPFMDGKDALEETEQNPNGPLHMYTQHSKIKGNLTVEPLYLDIESHSENLRFNERSAREQEMAQDLYDLLQNPVYANEPVQRTRSDRLCDSYRDESDVRENVEAQTDLAYNTGKMNETVIHPKGQPFPVAYEKDHTSLSSRILLAHLPAFFNQQQSHSTSSRDSNGSGRASLPPAPPNVPPPRGSDEDSNSDNDDLDDTADDEDALDSDSLKLTSEEDAWMKNIIKEHSRIESSAPTSIPTMTSTVADFSRPVVRSSSNTVAFTDASQSMTEPSEELDFEAMSGGEVYARMEELRRRLRNGVLLSQHSMDPTNK